MAGIVQAARWMREGRVVVRARWVKSLGDECIKLHICERFGTVRDGSEAIASFTADELLAEDWELAD